MDSSPGSLDRLPADGQEEQDSAVGPAERKETNDKNPPHDPELQQGEKKLPLSISCTLVNITFAQISHKFFSQIESTSRGSVADIVTQNGLHQINSRPKSSSLQVSYSLL